MTQAEDLVWTPLGDPFRRPGFNLGCSGQPSGASDVTNPCHTLAFRPNKVSPGRQLITRGSGLLVPLPFTRRRGLLILVLSKATRIDGPGPSRSARRLERRWRAVSLVQVGGPHLPSEIEQPDLRS